MKPTPLLLLAALVGGPAFALDASSAIPKVFPAERYEALIARSPFTLATPPAAPAAPVDKGFAEGWYVTSLGRVDGLDYVSIKARDGGVQFSLFGPEPKEGVSLQKVDWSNSIGRSTVTIAKEGQSATLEFNQAEVATQPAPPAPPQNIVRAGMPNAVPRPVIPRPVQPLVQPQGYGNKPTVQPNVNPSVPRPTGNIQSGVGILPNNGGVQPEGRRRIRVIQNNTTGQ